MPTRMIFEKGLEMLRQDTIEMGIALERLIEETIEAVITRDKEKAKIVIEKDDWFDKQEIKIEKECTTLIMQQQPIAGDLRFIMSTLKMVTDMERIADQCEDICRYSLKLDDGEWSKEIAYKRHIERMAKQVCHMLNVTVDALVQKDVSHIREVCEEDDIIDEAFRKIWKEIIGEMCNDSNFVKSGAEYIMIIKYLERIADHTTNIAEWLIYHLTGEYAKKY